MSQGQSTIDPSRRLEPDTLWNRLLEQTQFALDCGALQPIPTDYEYIEQGDVRFLVRIVSNLARKAKAKKQQDDRSQKARKDFNPFLPYEKNLFVTDISPTHLCLLNKFNVVEHHLLVVTRHFEHQETWLTQSDFEAMQACLQQIDGLAFYNGGTEAGASQKHKHLQLVPLPLMPDGTRLPIETEIDRTPFDGHVGHIPSFPFRHAIAPLTPDTDAETVLKTYYRLLQAVGLLDGEPTSVEQTAPYNLLATREWMFVVPRSKERFDSISVNALGFAGALLVRDDVQLQRLKLHRPIDILAHVANMEKTSGTNDRSS
ncbi:MAG: phosphorylase [Cyanobacteria bacterium SID2]|nr:phosphorylase [Cyanobacteria bacterium SID2]MBP0006462.1 phosphorylase [Cyanobacteria bacterium SBC]